MKLSLPFVKHEELPSNRLLLDHESTCFVVHRRSHSHSSTLRDLRLRYLLSKFGSGIYGMMVLELFLDLTLSGELSGHELIE